MIFAALMRSTRFLLIMALAGILALPIGLLFAFAGEEETWE